MRLKKAAGLLKKEEMKIVDIAMRCGFSSHSALTRAFRQVYGISPTDYKTKDIHLDHVIRPQLGMKYTLIDEGVPLICDDMVLEIHRVVCKDAIWFSGYLKEEDQTKIAQPKENTLVELWNRLEQDALLQAAAMDEGDDILTPSQSPGIFTYMAAVQTENPVQGYASFQMPPGTYVMCEYEAESFEILVQEALYKASAYLFEVWLPSHGYESDAFWFSAIFIQNRRLVKYSCGSEYQKHFNRVQIKNRHCLPWFYEEWIEQCFFFTFHSAYVIIYMQEV